MIPEGAAFRELPGRWSIRVTFPTCLGVPCWLSVTALDLWLISGILKWKVDFQCSCYLSELELGGSRREIVLEALILPL